jgi:hypothetical protein
MHRISGWNRLAIVLCTAWMLGAFAIAATEYTTNDNGWFVVVGPPAGSVLSGNQLTLPSGRTVKLKNGSSAAPWAIDWSANPGVPVTRTIRWAPLCSALLVPFFLWLFAAVLCKVGRWVKAGFRPGAA